MALAAAALTLALLPSAAPSAAAVPTETRAVSGGTVTFVKDGGGYYQVNTFVSDGTLSVSPSAPAYIALDFALVGGGGAAGTGGGAGGAGGVATTIGGPWPMRSASPGDDFVITVGAGGTAGARTGSPSSYVLDGSVTGDGGGAGAAANEAGGTGGSGGGGAGLAGESPNSGGGVNDSARGNVGGAAGPAGEPGSGGGYTSPGTAGGGGSPIPGGTGLNIVGAFGPVVDGGIVAQGGGVGTDIVVPANSGFGGHIDSDGQAWPGAAGVVLFRHRIGTVVSVTTGPTDQTVDEGDDVTFNVEVAGSPTPTIQWQMSSDQGATFEDVVDANANTLTFTRVSTANDGLLVRAVASNGVENLTGQAESVEAELTVSAAPAPAPPPAARPAAPTTSDVSVTTDQDTAVAVAFDASGTGTLTYSVDQPTDGTVTGEGPQVIYTPDDGFAGTDTFTYTATNAGGVSEPSTVTITVTATGVQFSDVGAGSTHAEAISRLQQRSIVTGLPGGTYAPNQAITRGQLGLLVARTLHEFGGDVDLPASQSDALKSLADRGIFTGFGDGTMRTGDDATRGQTASVIDRFLQDQGLTLRPGDRPFPDVSGVHADAINGLREAGVMLGHADGTFAPGGSLTRGQAATVLVALFDLLE